MVVVLFVLLQVCFIVFLLSVLHKLTISLFLMQSSLLVRSTSLEKNNVIIHYKLTVSHFRTFFHEQDLFFCLWNTHLLVWERGPDWLVQPKLLEGREGARPTEHLILFHNLFQHGRAAVQDLQGNEYEQNFQNCNFLKSLTFLMISDYTPASLHLLHRVV